MLGDAVSVVETGASKGTPSDARSVTEILGGGTKNVEKHLDAP